MIKSLQYSILTCLIFILGCSDPVGEVGESNTLPAIALHHKSVSSIDLSGIEIIDGPVFIYNTDATDLSFLSGIKEIRGQLKIHNNRMLESLNGIENLRSAETIYISGNHNLTDISSLREIEIQETFALNQNGITKAGPLNGLINPSGSIYINESLESLELFASLKSVENLKIEYTQIADLSGLVNLESVESRLTFRSNRLLNDFCEIKDVIEKNNSIILSIVGNGHDFTREEVLDNCE